MREKHRQVKRVELQREGVGESEVGLLRKVEGLQARASEGEVAAREREQQMKETRSETESLRRGLSMQVREGADIVGGVNDLSLQEGVSAGERVALEERQREEEKVREKVASLTSKLQHLHRETVAQVSRFSDCFCWCVSVCVCVYVCADQRRGKGLQELPPGNGENYCEKSFRNHGNHG